MLFLLPNLLDPSGDHLQFFPKSVDETLYDIEGLFAEDEKQARLYLKRFSFSRQRTFRDIPIKLVNEHTKPADLLDYLPLIKEQPWGLISDCGLPCIADPGANLVRLAHEKNIEVKTFVGPSSIIMALQLSGMYAQQFSFLGYLPRDSYELEERLKLLQKELEQGRVLICIEAPYRNQKLLEALTHSLPPQYRLCVAADLTLATQTVKIHTIKQWKSQELSAFQKRAAVFVLSKA